MEINDMLDPFYIAGHELSSRLFLGTGKYGSTAEMLQAVRVARPSVVTVALKRFDLENPDEDIYSALAQFRDLIIMPNTSGAKDHTEAIKAAHIGRELSGSDFVKVEIHPDSYHLMPDAMETFLACQQLVREKFIVMPYIQADPVLARRLEEIGCASVMPLGSVIGSGQGLVSLEFLQIIIQQLKIPVIVDAGIRSPSDVVKAFEIGAHGVLLNTALALSQNTELMAEAFAMAAACGRKAFLAGLMEKSGRANPSSLTHFLD